MILLFLLHHQPDLGPRAGPGPRWPTASSRCSAADEEDAAIDSTLIVDLPARPCWRCTALIIVRLRSLFAAVMLTGIYSFLGAGWMLLLDAPDVAFTEAAVGAGISTVLMLGTLALTTREEKPPTPHAAGCRWSWCCSPARRWSTARFDMPHYGDPDAPIHQHVAPRYLERLARRRSASPTSSPRCWPATAATTRWARRP